VEDHPLGRYARLELLHQVPGDCLALAVLVSGEQEFVGVLEQLLELRDLLLLVGVHDVQRLKVVVDVDTQPRPRFAAILRRYLGGLVWHIANVTDAGLDGVSLAEEAGDRPRLARRLDDDQLVTAVGPSLRGPGGLPGPWCQLSPILYIQSRPGGYSR
jgi:hypothetical protein